MLVLESLKGLYCSSMLFLKTISRRAIELKR